MSYWLTIAANEVIITLKSKLETIFKLCVFKLCHMPNLISIRVKLPELRLQALSGTKGPRSDRISRSEHQPCRSVRRIDVNPIQYGWGIILSYAVSKQFAVGR